MAEALKPEHGLETLAIQENLSSLRRLRFLCRGTQMKLVGARLRAHPLLLGMPFGHKGQARTHALTNLIVLPSG